MAEKRDYYEVLGINKSATDDEIKRAYRKLAKQYHPDANKDNAKESEEKFKEVSEAYETLSDSQKRAMYDQFGHNASNFGASGAGGYSSYGGFSGFDGFNGYADFSDLGDIFSSVFGGGFGGGSRRRNANAPQKGSDLRITLDITFEESFFGTEKEVSIYRSETCDECHGNGAKSGTKSETCTTCNGTGQVKQTQNTILGSFATVKTCNTCGGAGTIIKEPCPECRGKGKVRKLKKIKINIPAGVATGNIVSLREQGEAGIKGGPAGDLYVEINVGAHSVFKRKGDNIVLDISISFPQATLGSDIKIPTVDGKGVVFKIPEGTKTGTVFKIKGQGFKNVNGYGTGDILVTVNMETPKKLTKEQRELVEKLAESMNETVNKKRGFF